MVAESVLSITAAEPPALSQFDTSTRIIDAPDSGPK